MARSPRDELIFKLGTNRILAHQMLFSHRHPQATPPFHFEAISLFHSPLPRVLFMIFRGGSKSTIGEEGLIIRALFQDFRNALVLGATYDLAVERLKAIRLELETNEKILSIFGDLKGSTWNEDELVLSTNICLKARGRGQAMRGTKFQQWRPDFVLADDIEDEDSVATPEARAKVLTWWMKVVRPALDPSVRIRLNATPLDRQSLAVEFIKPEHQWRVCRYPIKRIDPQTGQWQAVWPERFPIDWVHKTQSEFLRLGMGKEFNQEYMCEPEDLATKTFTAEHIRTVAHVRTWHPTLAVYDPARTVKQTSAHTGKVVGSWVNNKLIIWDADGQLWLPDKIINDIFDVDEHFRPLHIGVEKDGLEEFLLQPLRIEQTKRQRILPILPLKAPTGKLRFISSMQPFFNAQEIEFAKDLPLLKEQLLSFPTGRIDIPNAMAYLLRMRPGLPIYEDFSLSHVAEELLVDSRHPVHLAVNAKNKTTVAALMQFQQNQLRIIADWLLEGDPGTVLDAIVKEAQLVARARVQCIAPPQHWHAHDVIGLRAACRKIPTDLRKGGDPTTGKEELRGLLRKNARGHPALRVSQVAARWSLNAFAGGYCRLVTKSDIVPDTATEGPYALLMEAIESFAALLRVDASVGDEPRNYAYDARGRQYLSARG